MICFVAIAQLDRASDCGSGGRRFESSWLQSAESRLGEMSERSKETDSKSVVPFDGTGGSNPPLSVSRVCVRIMTLERCPSGRRCTLGRGVSSNRAPRVRIPLSPFYSPLVLMVDSVLSLFAQPRQDRKVAAVSERSVSHRRCIGAKGVFHSLDHMI